MKGRRGWCNHYNGTVNKRCDAGVEYESVAVPREVVWKDGTVHQGKAYPCFAEGDAHAGGTSAKCQMATEEEIEERDAKIRRKMDLLRQSLSDCCEAPVDNSHVITSGRHKGHGSRYCSKCGKLLFMV